MKIAVIRLSSIGDLLLTIPVIEKVLEANRELEICLISRPMFAPLFAHYRRVQFIGFDPAKNKGITGLVRFAKALATAHKFEKVIDLHRVFRSIAISRYLEAPVFRIEKGRWEKWKLTRRFFKKKGTLAHTTERYAAAFKKAGLDLTEPPEPIKPPKVFSELKIKTTSPYPLIGIAPFSKHHQKEWPLEKMVSLATRLKKELHAKIYFLSSPAEKALIGKHFKGLGECIAGKYPLDQELYFISRLDLVITMDSANMHMAAISGTPTASIWGPTSVETGFAPIDLVDGSAKTGNNIIIENNNIGCRPCSVFGQKRCFQKSQLCMESITVEDVFNAILQNPAKLARKLTLKIPQK